jgi:DNA-binding MarR family transcriptional regulator
LSKYSLTGSAATPQTATQPATTPAAPTASTGANTSTQAATPPATPGATASPAVTPVQQNSIQHHILHTLAASGPSGLSFTQLAPSVRASSGASGKIGGLITSLTNQGHISYSNFSGGQYHITPQGAAAIANYPNPQPLPAGTTVNAPAPQTAIAPGSTEHHYLYNIASVTQSGPVSLTTFNQVQNVAHGNTPGVTVSPNVVTQLQNAGLVAVNNGMLSVTPAGHAALAQLPAINYHSTGNGWSLGGTPNAAHQPAPPSPPAAPAAATTPATGNPINLTPGTPHYRVMIGISNSPYGRLATANPLIANNQTEVNDLLAAGYLHDLNGMGYRLTPAGTAALSAAVPVSGHVHGAPSPAATQPATPATPAPTAPQPPAAQHVAGTSVSVTPDEQKVIAYLTTRHAKKPGVHIHFDSIKAATKIPQSQLAPLIDGLEQKGLLVKHPGSAGKRTGLSSYVLTGAAASSAMTPHATGGGTTAPVTPAQATPGNNTAASAPPANPYDDAFNAPPVGGYVVGPNSSFIHWGAAAGGGLPGAPVHALAVRAGRSTLPLNLDDPGPADGSQPRLDAQQYPDRNHAAAFGMTYQGPTGGIVTAIHGTDNRALLGGTVSGLRPGDTNAYGFGLYTWADSINHSQASYYTKGTNFVLEMHTGQCVHDTNTPALVQRFRNEHPTQYNALSHDNAKVTAAACLQYGYTTIVRDYGSRGSSPSYICLDPSRCRIKAVVDNSGNGLKLPNGKKSPDAPDIMKPPTSKVQGRQYVPQGAWFGTPDLAAVKDPRLVARNKAIGADPNVPLSDNGYNAIVEIGKHAPASMVTKSRVDQARDVTRLVLPVRSAGSPESLTSILEDGELISAAELKARHQAAQSDPTPAGQALAAKYGAAIAAAPNNPVDPVLGLDKSVLMTYGGPTPYSTYGDYAMVFKKEVLNTPGAKVGIHSPNAYNGNSMGAAGVSNLNVDEWNKHEIDGAEADEVMAYQLAAGFPVTQATKTRVTHGVMPQNGMLSNPTDYIDGHNLRASELSEVHIPTSVSAHHISHILIPSGRRYQPDQDKAGNQNAMHDHWNVAPGLHDSLKGRFSTFDAGTFASLNPHLANDGQKISLDGLPLTMRKVSTPAGRSSWKFEVPAQASRSVPLKQHLEDLCKRKGLDIKIVETNHGRNGNPHKVNGKSAYAQICYQQL